MAQGRGLEEAATHATKGCWHSLAGWKGGSVEERTSRPWTRGEEDEEAEEGGLGIMKEAAEWKLRMAEACTAPGVAN